MAKPNYERDSLYDLVGLKRMKDSYLKNGENSPQDRLVNVANSFSSNAEHAKRLYEYASKHWLSFSTPILSYDENSKYSFPISCYLCYLPDNLGGIISTLSETNALSVCGGGVSVKVSLRSPSEKSMGAITHIKTYDSCVLAYKQGNRRGSYAMYIDIDHPEIQQFIELRKPTGDYNMRCLNVHHCVNITDKFMMLLKNSKQNDDWPLIDPHTKKIVQTVSAKKLWQNIIETRRLTGEPYLCFIDRCNEQMNKYQKRKGFKIEQSNLCTEVVVPTSKERSSLCCLASLNVEYYDDWKNNELIIRDVMEMLDNVLLKFIEKSSKNKDIEKYFSRILESAKKEKNIGIGVMGFASYLQKKSICIEDEEAFNFNETLFKWLNETCEKYNKQLAEERGSPDDIKESGLRFAYTMAIAPTATTSIIMGNTSPGIEPYRANIYRQDTVSGSQYNKNKNLRSYLKNKNLTKVTEDKVWSNIIANKGSVYKIPNSIISEKDKKIFKTFSEIDQKILVKLAAQRQKYIDQGQSLTLTFGPNVSVKEIHDAHMLAWESGLKTLYYLRSEKVASADVLSSNYNFIGCESCES